MIRPTRATLIAATALVASLPMTATAQDTTSRGVRIGLTYDPGTKPGVLILPIAGRTGDSLTAIVRRDLDFGDRVTVIDGASVGVTSATRLDYDVVGKLGALGVVQGTVTASGLHVALHDVGQKRVVSVQDFALPAQALDDHWRLAVHKVSDEIERWITGTRGIAATRIIYVHDRRLWVVDSDGANPRPVTERGTVLSPVWHRDGKHVAYSAFAPAGTQIAVRNLETGTARWLSAAPGGLNITPTFSPDGSTIVWAHGQESGTDLFAAPALGGGGPVRRVTVGRGSDNVSPSFSPDGRRIAFTSGRSGHPEVYITDVDGSNAELLTPYNFGDQSYRSNPDWSPDGRTIAFQSQIAGRFQVMTISLRDRRIRQLTSEGTNEDPSWAPDGRHLVFSSTRSGARQLYVVDVESGRVRQLTRAPGARLAAWSPWLGGAR